jgi:hypothetical protein
MMKNISPEEHPFEAEVGQYFSPELISQPANHCISILRVLHCPKPEDGIVLIMPLMRKYDDPELETFFGSDRPLPSSVRGMSFLQSSELAHIMITGLSLHA